MHIPEVFISYKIGESRSESLRDALTDLLEKDPYNLRVITDVKHLRVLDDLKAFMTRLAQAKFVIVILTEAYLKSENCMFELATLANEGKLGERVFPIVYEDVTIKDSKARLAYARHWSNALKEVQDQVAQLPFPQRANSTKADLQKLEKIVLGCQDALAGIANMRYMGLQSGESLDAGRIAEYIKGWTKDREKEGGFSFIRNLIGSRNIGSSLEQDPRLAGGRVFGKGAIWLVIIFWVVVLTVLILNNWEWDDTELALSKDDFLFLLCTFASEFIFVFTTWKCGQWAGRLIGIQQRGYGWVGPVAMLLPSIFAGFFLALMMIPFALERISKENSNGIFPLFKGAIAFAALYFIAGACMSILAGKMLRDRLQGKK